MESIFCSCSCCSSFPFGARIWSGNSVCGALPSSLERGFETETPSVAGGAGLVLSAMAAVRPQLGTLQAQRQLQHSAMTLSSPSTCTLSNPSYLLNCCPDAGIRETRCANFQAMNSFSAISLRNGTCSSCSSSCPPSIARVSPSVSSWKFDPVCVMRPCECAHASSHLNFQLPSKKFAGLERVPGGMNFDAGSGLECKSASYNSQFGSERVGKNQDSHPNFGFFLHDLMDLAGIETTHARAARVGFAEEVAKLRSDTLASESRELVMVDVARAALEIAAEDDALVSHSSVPLPVDSYLERLDSMAAEFAGHHLPAYSPHVFEALEKYLWTYKGFRSTKSKTSRDARDFYLNGVLTRRQGPPVMLGLIYSEVVKRLWRSGAINCLVDMNIPVDDTSFPLPIYKKPNGPSGSDLEDEGNNAERIWALAGGSGPDLEDLNQNLLTPKDILLEVLRSLKKLYWPWRNIPGSGQGSDFLEAATAASRGTVSSASSFYGPFESLFNAPSSERGSELARARAAQYRLQRGIWTSTTFGDLRRALAASERLVMIGGDKREYRDYGMLLFHAGLYEQAFQYLNSYSSIEVSAAVPPAFNALEAHLEAKETVALDRLLERLSLIMTERSWNRSSDPPPPIVSPPDPW